ncbi:sugar isomerase domain-containing protein [Thermosediminibacter litoriperuensis]|uniref:Putative phosphosugar-binding protein n=1 Tax=Thermosediminibacter litoriperuensis TaxID=291989 RepID=A0A5S5ANK0_9FIRM|nr:SIS domain-containing protein [Thermosediminibacter litoriperuensis]TYP53237.1 putative phosphosugar-binding protein [Thermosediminibacter litoriperuensis]
MDKKVEYYKIVNELLESILKDEKESIEKAAEVLAKAIMEDRLIHVVGTGGHSNMGAEELFWRAGGLVPINPLLDAGISLSNGAKHSNIMERTPGYGLAVMKSYDFTPGDPIIIVNAYGINAMTIDIAMEAKRMGLTTIGITSTSFAKMLPKDHPARHESGKNLYEIVDIFIDCHLPLGDAVIKFDDFEQKVAPTSTLVNTFTLNLLVVETVNQLLKKGVKPPVWVSANMPGGDEANKEYEKKYFGRIKHLR